MNIIIYIGLFLIAITIAFNKKIAEDNKTYIVFFIAILLYFISMVAIIAVAF
jgi:hypothetical protein